MRIWIDAMWGDFWPEVVVSWAMEALIEEKTLLVTLYWNKEKIQRIIDESDLDDSILERIEIQSTNDIDNIPQDKKVTSRGEIRWAWVYANSSMMLPIHDLVSEKSDVSSVLSAGNTASFGFWVTALCKKIVRVKGPMSLMITSPNKWNDRWSSVVLDVGADVWTNKTPDKIARKIVEDAILAYSYCKNTLGIENPKIWLLNIGWEDDKWNDPTKLAFSMLSSEFPDAFIWNVEPNNLCKNNCDIIVTDGFTWNIALKTVEWVVKLFAEILKEAATDASLIPRLWAKLAKQSIITAPFDFFDPNKNPAAVFTGLEQAVAKVHGDSDYIWFKNWILQLFHYQNQLSQEVVRRDIQQQIETLRNSLPQKDEA